MDPTTPLHQDGDTSATPLQEPQKTCTRNTPCNLQGCMICRTPTNHVRNLEDALGTTEDAPASPSSNAHLQLPVHNTIRILTNAFSQAIQLQNINHLSSLVNQYKHQLDTELELFEHDLSVLDAYNSTAKDIINSHTALSTPLPSSPPIQRTPPPQASFKPPKLIIENWNGKPYDFYTWLSSILHGFELAQCDDPGKLHHTLHAIPMDKRGVLNHITNWDEFKIALIKEFGSVRVFGREVDLIFSNLRRCESVQEATEELAPRIKKLQSSLATMTQFHRIELLHGVAITQSLNTNIIRSLPSEVRSEFNQKYTSFQKMNPDNILAPNTFCFLAQFVDELRENYQSDPSLYDLDLSPLSIGVKPVRYESPNTKPKPPTSSGSPEFTPRHPCSLCTVKGFQADHFALSYKCGVGKLSSPDIQKIISENHLCPSCTLNHPPTFKCRLTYTNGESKVCTRGCLRDGLPLHKKACMHYNHSPSFTVSRVSLDKSVPLVEDILVGQTKMGIQYDTGCQLSLISRSALASLSPASYTIGNSTKVKVMTYAGEGKVILTTEVKLRVQGKVLKLSIIEEDLNHGSGFQFSVPHKWRSFTRSPTAQHTGQLSILLGGDNHLFFPREIERDPRGMALYQSNLTQSYMVYGSIPSNIITWVEPLISSSNQIRRRTRQSRRKTGGEVGTSGRNREKNQEIQEKNQNIRKRNRRRTRNFRKKSEGEPDTPTAPKPPTNPNPPTMSGNPGTLERNRKRTRNFRKKSEGEPDTPTTPKPLTNLNPPTVSGNSGTLERNRKRTRNFRKKSEGEPDTPTTPELPANLNPPQEPIHGLTADSISEHVAPAPTVQRAETQDEFHEIPSETEN